MRHAQIIHCGLNEGPLLTGLEQLAQDRGVWLRGVRRPESCWNLLRQGGPGVLVLKVGRRLEEELALLEQVGMRFPQQATVVVGDAAHPGLAGLAWDLGARCVLFPPQPMELLPEIVARLLPLR